MSSQLFDDNDFLQLCEGYSEPEIKEIETYLAEWGVGTYASVAQSVVDHANRKGVKPLKYLRQAHSFNKKRAKRIPPGGYRLDGSAVYRKGQQYLIVHPDACGAEKIVTFGSMEE